MKVFEKIIDNYDEYTKNVPKADPRALAYIKMKNVIMDALCELGFANEMESIDCFTYSEEKKVISIETTTHCEAGWDEYNIDMTLVDFDTIVEVYRGLEKDIKDLKAEVAKIIVNKKKAEKKRAALETLSMATPSEITESIIAFNTECLAINKKIKETTNIMKSIIT